MILRNPTKHQCRTMVMLFITDFCSGLCLSLPAPFYPYEAEKKGASATEYGFVFGIFELTTFITSPMFGERINQIGPKTLLARAMFISGGCTILFGCLDLIEQHYYFIIISFAIGVLRGLGNSAYIVASFAICAREFPDNVATVFSTKEAFLGLGMILGPTIGGALYQIGGYMAPFITLGSFFLFTATIATFVLPNRPQVSTPQESCLPQLLKIPGVFLSACSIALGSSSAGFLNATLEPHIRQFELPPMIKGFMFIIVDGTYSASAPFYGWLCEKNWISPKAITLFGSCLFIISFCLIGPAPFIALPTILGVTILGLVLTGFGLGACYVAGFTDILRTVISQGYPNNLETLGLISGLWSSSNALGSFIGPSVAGILRDALEIRRATMFVVILSFIVSIMTATFICYSSQRRRTCKKLDSLGEFYGTTTNVHKNGKGSRNLRNVFTIFGAKSCSNYDVRSEPENPSKMSGLPEAAAHKWRSLEVY